MTKYRDKFGLVNAIQTEHRRLEELLATVTNEQMVENGVVGTWSIKDGLAHLTAWEQLFLNWYDAGLHGKTPSPPLPVGMSRNAIDTLNQDIFERNRNRSLSSIWSDFETSYQQILTTVQEAQEEDIFTPSRYNWTGRLLLADYIAGNTCNHYLWARTHIRKWIKAQNTK